MSVVSAVCEFPGLTSTCQCFDDFVATPMASSGAVILLKLSALEAVSASKISKPSSGEKRMKILLFFEENESLCEPKLSSCL